jgi:Ice-binding-like
MHNFFRSLILAAVVVCTSSAFAAGPDTLPDGTINIGSGAIFSVLTSGDFSATDNTFTGSSYVKGNVGIGGSGNFSMSDGTIDGDIYMHTGGTFTKSGPATVNGSVKYNQDATINAALNDIKMLSMTAGAEMSSPSALYRVNGNQQTLTTVNTGKSMTVSDFTATNPFNGSKIVLNLTDFVLTGGTFTLQGGAMTTYIINVSRNFSINNSSVILSGGLLASHVLFNVLGTGNQVSLNQGTQLSGRLVAMQRKVSLSGGKIYGRLYANQVAITSGGQVISN